MPARTVSPAPVELDRWRRDTPGCRDRIHLNNAGAGLMPRPVLDALTEHLAREAAIGGYEAADEAEPRVRETYALVGRLVGAAPRNIALVENATVAFSQALSAFDFRPGDRIVTTRTDYPSTQLMYLSRAQRAGVETVRADDLSEGGVDPESVRRLARHPRTRLVALSWVPTNSGLVQDARAVGEVCAELGVPYLVDACQTVGQMAVDVTALRCDFLAATGRKFLRGPRGIGFLYVSDRLLGRPQVGRARHGRQARRHRAPLVTPLLQYGRRARRGGRGADRPRPAMTRPVALLLAIPWTALPAQARKSQHATVMQALGATEVTIVYNRPAARGRTLFGDLVPWGKVWCPGADQATTLAVTKDVLVAGQPLAAGKYSIWAIPGPAEWTLIFSKAADVFHIPYPGPAQDALRVTLKPQAGPFMEALAFYFPAADADRALLNLHWGETVVQVPLAVR